MRSNIPTPGEETPGYIVLINGRLDNLCEQMMRFAEIESEKWLEVRRWQTDLAQKYDDVAHRLDVLECLHQDDLTRHDSRNSFARAVIQHRELFYFLIIIGSLFLTGAILTR